MRERCLVCVDDERIVLSSLRDQLRGQLGSEVTIEIAESGEEGIELVGELLRGGVEVPLVISDQLMPGMKGEEFLARAHALDPRILTVLLTGQATAEAVGAAVNTARLYRFIGKPWSRDDLARTVRSALSAWDRAREVERKKAEILETHAASLRFVPAEMLAMMGRSRVLDVRFGDCVEREVTVLFARMRGWSRWMDGRSATEAIALVNDHVRRMEAPIRAHGGFISHLEGDAILALFPEAPEHAVAAAIAAQRALGAGDEPVSIGVNTGRLVVGAIGSEDRLQCDLVGDAVNLAARIEGLTRHYDTPLLLSGHTAERIEAPIGLREVDRVCVKGKQRAVTLYEVLDALPASRARARLETTDAFQEARTRLASGDLVAAGALFDRVLVADADDTVARLLRDRCRMLGERGLPPDWSGVMGLDFK